MKTIVLGGGIAGITAAYKLNQLGVHASVYEAAQRAGGLLDNFSVNGFRFDQAVHVSFASEAEVREVFDRTEYNTHSATTWCWEGDTWLRHPVQNNLFPLSVEERAELIDDFINRPDIKVENYKDWLIYQYGEKIASRWPLIYTEKYWTVPAEKLGVKWIGDRMRRADTKEVIMGAMTEDTPNTYYLKDVRYPKSGGYRAFIEPMINEVDVIPDKRAVEVNLKKKCVRFDDATKAEFDRLICTIPLPSLIEIMDDVPPSVVEDARTLFATRVDLISVAFSRPDVPRDLWFYIYDTDLFASRAYSPSMKSALNAPPGTSSMQFEFYSSRERPMIHTSAELKDNVRLSLRRMGLAQDCDILFMDHRYLPFGNVVFDLGMEERRARVRNWVEQAGIVMAGRFGEWDYLWSNQSFISGANAARKIYSEL